MSQISRVALFAKLNPLAFRTVEGATVLCKLRTNPYVELVHWIAQILQQDDSDWHHILRHFELDANALLVDVQSALERLPAGAHGISDLSEHLTNAVERAWVYGSLMFGASAVRTGHVLLALLKTDYLHLALTRVSSRFRQIPEARLAAEFAVILAHSPEVHSSDAQAHETRQGVVPGEASGAIPAAQLGGQEALKRYTIDLTAKAQRGEIDPVCGRELEIRQMVDILLRRRQNNPLITGEAGVGKTALVEGFALQVTAGLVPPALQSVRVLSLDLGLLQAGASMKGEFEQRLRQVIDEVQVSAQGTILFIDEVHTLVGAGGQQGTGDAANLLKPALARGSLRTIGATTWAEYKKYIEKDPALTRRFQVVQVAEPTEQLTVNMLRGLVPAMQQHHGVWVQDEAVQAAVKLSHRYIPARQLPDKAISLLDTACSRVAVSLHGVPLAISRLEQTTQALLLEQKAIRQEVAWGTDHSGRLNDIELQLESTGIELDALNSRWSDEKRQVDALLKARVSNSSNFKEIQAQLMSLQGEAPMVFAQVDARCVAAVVADWTGIPVGRMVRNEIETVLNLTHNLGQRIVGQSHALACIARRIQTHRAGLDDPDKPVGVFLLAGSSGVGKTETALALAEQLYGGEHNVITINMSEYQEAHTVSSLKGAPPGYVGYGEGGVLTEAVRRRPHSVVLLDEVEKAHPDVHELFFQVFDKGWMEDGEGRRIDFRHTLILLTTNVGTDALMQLCRQGDAQPDPQQMAQALRRPLLEVFPPALLGRLDVVPYYPLSRSMLASIVRLQLSRLQKRMQMAHRIDVAIDDTVVDHIIGLCNQADSGGRVVGSILCDTLLPTISRQLLEATLDNVAFERLQISAGPMGFAYDFA